MSTSGKKKIAKNTAYLYIRMILVMVVALYTNRVVLNVLGFTEYGVYNVIAGVVVLFTFLNSSMTASSQRYLCVGIGKEDLDYQRIVFRSSIKLHLATSLIFFLIAEPIGIWMINHVLNLPGELHTISIIIYQFALLTSVCNILRIPFNAAIIAHERMDFYAYSSIVESVLKLLILLPLVYVNENKLILYGILVLSVQGVLLLWYIVYTRSRFKELFTGSKVLYKQVMVEMLKFSVWSNFSSIANICSKQGLGIIANMFVGVIVNAAIGIMNQVTSAVYTFITNFQTAVNPPLIKYYTKGDFAEVQNLVILSSKFSFYLMWILTIPIIFNIDCILQVWLTKVPHYTVSLCICALISLLPNVFGGPLWTIMQASGKIKSYQTIIGCIIISNLPVDCFLLDIGFEPYTLLIYSFFVNLSVVIVGIKFLSNRKVLQSKILAKSLGLPIMIVSTVSLVLTYAVTKTMLKSPDNVVTLLLNTFVILIIVGFCIIVFGMSGSEKKVLVQFIHNKRR